MPAIGCNILTIFLGFGIFITSCLYYLMVYVTLLSRIFILGAKVVFTSVFFQEDVRYCFVNVY